MKTLQIGGKTFTLDELAVLEKHGLINVGEKHDTSSTTPTAVPTHGILPGNSAQYGIFSGAGVRPGMWNATPRVRSIARVIPMFPSRFNNELIQIATGVTAGSGNNVTNACTVGPKPGALKAMKVTASFGIVHISSPILDITQAGLRKNRADVDRMMYNAAGVDNPWLPQIPGISALDDPFNNVVRTAMFALGVELERNVSQVHFVGVSGTENNTYRGVARQWAGLDSWVKTGYVDADSGYAAERADSYVYSFNAAVNGSDAQGNSLVRVVSDTWYMMRDWLRSLGIEPNFALVMRPDLFRAVVEQWSCAYAVARCSDGSAGSPVNRDATATRALFDAMIQGEFLLIDGNQVPVVLDDSIARETLANGMYKSDIYGLMLSGNGIPTVYGEYFPMDNPEAQELEAIMGGTGGETITLNNGMYRMFVRKTGGCYEYDFFARPRLITDTPFAHFRVDDIRYYANSYRLEAPIPGFSGYRNGGVTYLTS